MVEGTDGTDERRGNLLSVWMGISLALYAIALSTYFSSFADKMPQTQMRWVAGGFWALGIAANIMGVIRLHRHKGTYATSLGSSKRVWLVLPWVILLAVIAVTLLFFAQYLQVG